MEASRLELREKLWVNGISVGEGSVNHQISDVLYSRICFGRKKSAV